VQNVFPQDLPLSHNTFVTDGGTRNDRRQMPTVP